MPIWAFLPSRVVAQCWGVTDLLALVTLAVVAVGARAVLARLQRLLEKVDAIGRQLHETRADHDQAIESFAQRQRATEQAAANAEETGRAVSRQLTELNKITVDQAVVLVGIRDDLMRRLPGTDGRPTGRQAESKGSTP
jgi:ABC-type transporter Mla subunit MlaD